MSNLANSVPQCQVPDDLIPHFLPGGGISLLAGAPSVGKTAWVASLLFALRHAMPVFGHPTRIVSIGYVNVDRGWEKGAGLWLRRAGVIVPHYSLNDDPNFDPKLLRRKIDRIDLLAQLIDRLNLPTDSLVVVDPVTLFLGGNLLDYDACACACLGIRAYLRLRRLTLLALVHAGKLKADKSDRYVRATDRVLGSTAITGFSDAVLYLASPEEVGKPYYELTWQPHGAKAETHKLERDAHGLFVPYSGVDNEKKARVLSCLPDNGEPTTLRAIVEAAEQFNLSQSTVQRTLNELLDDGRIDKPSHNKYRKIPLV